MPVMPLTEDQVRWVLHLKVQVFDPAYAAGGFGPDTYPCWSAYVNRDILAMFGNADWIGIADVGPLFQAHAARMVERYENATWRKAGNLFHYARALGIIVEEVDPERGRGWRLVSRETWWIVEGTGGRKRAVQVRGLPPAEQALQYKREATARKRNATLDRSARFKADEAIALQIARIINNDPDAIVPELWAKDSFVPDWLPGSRVDASATILREAHHTAELNRPKLKEWIEALTFFGDGARYRYRRRNEERAAQGEHIDLPADDDAALEALL